MWLIVGLGNPGTKYARTRHNVGFVVLEGIAEKSNLPFKTRKDYRISSGSIDNNDIVLLEPLTFMNRSGTVVRKIKDRFTITPQRIIVIHDDLDLDVGKLKIRRKGSSGGHRGIESIIGAIGSRDFLRVKIGIGRNPVIPPEEYVLSRFKRNELSSVRQTIRNAVDAVHSIITEGVDRSMNRFN